MEVFSLEDDDCNELFITQESKEDSGVKTVEGGQFLGHDVFDFKSPCTSFVTKKEAYVPECEDISDSEFDGLLMEMDESEK